MVRDSSGYTPQNNHSDTKNPSSVPNLYLTFQLQPSHSRAYTPIYPNSKSLMTRPEKISKRKAFNKAIRARAAEEQTSFVSVLLRTLDVQGTRPYRSKLNLPTHPDRPTRRNMMGRDQLKDTETKDTDTDPTHDRGHAVRDQDGVEQEKKTVVIDLMAIAKPAKVKGVAKEYEVVKRVKDVIVLEDHDEDIGFGGDDWEALNYDDGSTEKRTYSAALSGR